ncbi:IS3 family transposase [Tamlana sp. 2201CG12-4]|uniref:IS3 family transposase n=1 Tax=Tamlana sp. 2201CG12-4 TaxID=3112582 RepID=UPI002DB682C9|nr:IS3 family transposase [Tamlana sp. 2201CG12-4]MEC3905709.1 IS3 family transposase [Tamlana sp. 2201CG12-4]
MNRQVYYRAIQSYKDKQKLSKKVIDLVNTIRISMPRIGTRKLFHLLKHQLKIIGVGRDKLFKILKANNLLITPKKKYHTTTDSHHRFRKHKNRIKEVEFVRPEQVWVSDITYIGNRENPCYLALITDAYSKKIMGYNVSDSLNVEGALSALDMAISNRSYSKEPIIHHSDRGLQYCANEYQKILNINNIRSSMTEKYDPYENAIAERINGILKQEFAIDKYHTSMEIKTQLIKNAIGIYNQIRPHLSNSMLTPNQMHQQNKLKRKSYKKQKVAN